MGLAGASPFRGKILRHGCVPGPHCEVTLRKESSLPRESSALPPHGCERLHARRVRSLFSGAWELRYGKSRERYPTSWEITSGGESAARICGEKGLVISLGRHRRAVVTRCGKDDCWSSALETWGEPCGKKRSYWVFASRATGEGRRTADWEANAETLFRMTPGCMQAHVAAGSCDINALFMR
jgi:hypothetical protein